MPRQRRGQGREQLAADASFVAGAPFARGGTAREPPPRPHLATKTPEPASVSRPRGLQDFDEAAGHTVVEPAKASGKGKAGGDGLVFVLVARTRRKNHSLLFSQRARVRRLRARASFVAPAPPPLLVDAAWRRAPPSGVPFNNNISPRPLSEATIPPMMSTTPASPAPQPAPPPLLVIDGGQGEGGGQILRTAVSLAAVLHRPVRVTRIRANRPRPGLAKQHATCIAAAAEVCGATVVGGEVGSLEMTFTPPPMATTTSPSPSSPPPPTFAFDVGSAGSTTLVLQTLLPILLFGRQWQHSPSPVSLTIAGGTHNGMAPPLEFIAHAFLPALAATGLRADVTLLRHGFYPAGGGKIAATVQPVGPYANNAAAPPTASPAPPATTLHPLHLLDRGAPRGVYGTATVANLPRHIAERELQTLASNKSLLAAALDCGHGPGVVPPVPSSGSSGAGGKGGGKKGGGSGDGGDGGSAKRARGEGADTPGASAAAAAAAAAASPPPAAPSSASPPFPAGVLSPPASGPGNVVQVLLAFANACEVVSSFGEKGRPAEAVAAAAAAEAASFLSHPSAAPVSPHLADQLLLPLALGAGGTFRATELDEHFRTNVAVIESFLGAGRISTREAGPEDGGVGGGWVVEVRGRGKEEGGGGGGGP
jgi:RNA 3'-terminal phosphate cyclase